MPRLALFWMVVALASCARSHPNGSDLEKANLPPSLIRSTVGNGSEDFNPEADSAWFLGRREVRYCVITSPEFGISARVAELEIKRAFETWRLYLIRKKVNDRLFNAPNFARVSLFLNHRKLDTCDGTEDLRFYLGEVDEQVRTFGAKYHRPYGFAERTEYDSDSGWGKGFIWLAPEGTFGHGAPKWNRPFYHHFHAAILHELGHVLGCGHVNGTVMERNLSASIERLNLSPASIPDFRVGIDWRRELYFCKECEVQWTEAQSTVSSLWDPQFLKGADRAAMPRVILGPTPGAGAAKGELNLFFNHSTLEVDRGVSLTHISFTGNGVATSDPIFRVRIPFSSLEHGLIESYSLTFFGTAKLHGADANPTPVSFILNGPEAMYAIYPLAGQWPWFYFRLAYTNPLPGRFHAAPKY